MSEQDITPQEGMNPEPEVVEETVAEETTETPAEATEETTEETVPKSQFNQVLARAKKAEAQLKSKSETKANANQINNPIPDDVVDARILKSQGMKDELLQQLKDVAKLKKISLIDAQTDPLFLAVKDNFEKEAKKVALPASRGSAPVKKVKGFQTPKLSDAEHKELWRERNS